MVYRGHLIRDNHSLHMRTLRSGPGHTSSHEETIVCPLKYGKWLLYTPQVLNLPGNEYIFLASHVLGRSHISYAQFCATGEVLPLARSYVIPWMHMQCTSSLALISCIISFKVRGRSCLRVLWAVAQPAQHENVLVEKQTQKAVK